MRWAVLLLCVAACGGAPAKPTDVTLAKAPSATAAPAASDAPRLRTSGPSAVEIVRELGEARIVAIVEVGELRDHPVASRLLEVMPYVKSLDRAGIDPRNEIDRILLAERSIEGRGAMAIYQHHIDAERIDRFLDLAAAESQPTGSRTLVEGRRCALLFRRDMRGIACVAAPSLLFVSFAAEPTIVEALGSSSGIPRPPAGEAVHATFLRSASTSYLGPLVLPETLGTLELGMRADKGGALDIRGVAPSENPASDARALEVQIRQSMSGVLRALAPPFKIEAVGSDVVLTSHLSRDDLDVFMTIVSLTLPL